MGDLWLFLLLPLSLVAFHGVKGCLECDPKFKEDIKSLLEKVVPSKVPDRTQLLEWQIKEMINISVKVTHGNKMLRVLDVQKVASLKTWLKNELYKVGNKTWKGVFILQGQLLDIRQNLESKLKEILKHFSELACSEDCTVTEGAILDCWRCLHITTQCFKGEYCGGNKDFDVAFCGVSDQEEDSRKSEKREIALFLILIAEAIILGAAVLLFYICVTHRKKMKTIRRSLEKYSKEKLEKLMRIRDEENEDFGISK